MKRIAIACLLVVAACGRTAAPTSATSTPIAPRHAIAPTPAVEPTTTTTTVIPTTTTTVTPLLDRADDAVLRRLHADLDALLAMGPRVSGSPAEAAAARYFAAEVAAITGLPARIEAFPLPTGETSWNVWSSEIGRGHALLVIGSHVDSVAGSPGADDNASGVVTILELLRRLAAHPPDDLRIVIAAFGAEERIGDLGHHHGSRYAVARLDDGDALPDLMLSVDMVGVGAEIVSTSLRGHDPTFADALAAVGGSIGIPLLRLVRGEISDHAPFARAGVPSAHLWRSGNAHYHRPGDDQVSDDVLLENLRLLEALLAHLSPAPVAPAPAAWTHPD